MNFGSDNMGPAHPAVMDAVVRANDGYAIPYGDDALMTTVRDQLRRVFEAPEAEVFLVATGTAANSLSLSTLVDPWQAIFCSAVAHIHCDECGAPELFTGGSKLILVPETDARIDAPGLLATIREGLPRGLHYVQPGALSLTQLTERGTVYPIATLAELGRIAKDHEMPVHLDGARFANALVSLGCTPAEMTWKAGVDAVSFGATKNGCLGVEAVILFDPGRATEFTFRRKRGAHLFSKHRYLSAQMQAYLQDDLWLTMARSSNAAMARLAQGLGALPHATLIHPVEANMAFVTLPRAAHRRAVAAGAEYFLTLADLEGGKDDDPVTARFVTNWSTTDEEVDRFLTLVSG